MSQRDAALLKRVLKQYRMSPERAVQVYPHLFRHYSARSLRRWMEGEPMPAYVREHLAAFGPMTVILTSPTE